MKKKVCFAGKGGVGKSSCVILFLKYIIANFPESKKLIIDADPDANILDLLNESLGLYGTIGGEIIELKKKIDRKEVPPNVSERKLIEETILKNIKKNRQFDVVVQGRREGEGCYCSVNNVVKSIIDTLEEIYQFVIIDSPAGLEFFSRKTAKDIDDLILVTDMSKMSFHTIERLIEIKEEVEAKFRNIWILVNKYNANTKAPFIKRIEEFSNGEARLLGFLDYNPEIQRINFETKSLLEISKDNPIYHQAQEVFSSLFK
ncbi:MAG: CobQ/CobB/MinD/ParA nucleotide binding domain protein [Promethearchaeota archaeon]|jgi:CO dehydrogenase maturation factor|nr:MAG: CobQ/CobB/MinD/ParA nucleotide binding domain protein [Candidatus Lokiarchaeota archaeon]